MLADVRIRAGALGAGAHAEAAGKAGLDRWCVLPVGVAGDVGQRHLCPWRQDTDVGSGQVESALVFGAHGGDEQFPVAQTHRRRRVAEQHHQGLQRNPGIDQSGGIGVSAGGEWQHGRSGYPPSVGGYR